MISLKIIYNDGEKESLVFNQPTITIGRSSDNDVSLITAHGVSRHHAKLYREGDTLIVEDLNSTNGTYLNSQKITKSPVVGKDVIEVGSVCIKAVISNLAENAAIPSSPIVEPEPQVDAVDNFRKYLPEALEKINEKNVEKVIIRPNTRVKFVEQGQEVELGVVYPDEVLLKLVDALCLGRASATLRVKIDRNVTSAVLAPPLVNDGVCVYFQKNEVEEFSLEDYVSQGTWCRDAERMITEAYMKSKNIIFAGADRQVIQSLMLALVEEKDSRVCFLDRFAKLVTPKNGVSFSASNSSDLIELGQFSNDIGLHRFFIDDVEYYCKNSLSTFAGGFSKGGIAFLHANNIKKLHLKVGELSGYGADFWCHVLVWLEQVDNKIVVKNIFKSASTDAGLELVEIFSK